MLTPAEGTAGSSPQEPRSVSVHTSPWQELLTLPSFYPHQPRERGIYTTSRGIYFRGVFKISCQWEQPMGGIPDITFPSNIYTYNFFASLPHQTAPVADQWYPLLIPAKGASGVSSASTSPAHVIWENPSAHPVRPWAKCHLLLLSVPSLKQSIVLSFTCTSESYSYL